jgi:rod shape-determining protein MreD
MSTILPAAVIAFLTLVSALPWGLPPEIRFVLPLLPLVAIHYWIVRGTGRVAEWFVFASGLTLDVLTNGPLGYWSIMYLTGYLFSTLLAPRARLLRFGGWASLVLVTACLSVAVWAVSSLYSFEIADWRPLVIASFAAACIYPVLAGLLSLFEPATSRASDHAGMAGGGPIR